MKFTFTVASTGNKYTAEKVEEGFIVKWQDDFGNDESCFYTKEEGERFLEKCIWVVDARQADKAKNAFAIKDGQIESAARFIVANNSYMHDRTTNEMIETIKRTIKRMVDEINNGQDSWYTGSAGYVVTIMKEGENYYVVEVLVNPSVSQDKEFINVEEII